jgi:hypothetical protein
LAERYLGINLKVSFQSANQEEHELSPAQIGLVAKRVQVLLPLYAIFKELIAKNNLERLIGSIHDELMLEVREEQAEEHA